MTDGRERPEFGEYATPEEQQALRMPLDPRASHDPSAPLAQLASMENANYTPLPPAAAPGMPDAPPAPARRGGLANRIVTLALLAYGLVSVLTTIPRYLDFASLANEAFQMAGIPGEFSNFAQGSTMGTAAAFILAVGFALTAWVAIRRLRRGQRAWWVPIVGSLVVNIPVVICLMTALMNDPAMIDYASLVGA
ncbi:MAG: hypothetical protein GX871_03865 [Microbacteriaceae bacterium]|jgi:hypothetical protein|nr:hypothetical protein [Microbacteriaceae bacterium]HOA86096.1 DUF6264 family protein [Microbacteriaceae bacterium]HPZ35407.1 DUF6264 family protein [Microbacteriaceae bacterium]HQC92924.1 DUF6264 family protein [Microbacteriaceae bacterium]